MYMTRTMTLYEHGLEACLVEGVAVLRRGGVVLFPTETIYGLAADHRNSPAVKRISDLKGRDVYKPMGLIISNRQEVLDLAASVPDLAEHLMDRHWPGPLTLILEARPHLSRYLVSPQGRVGMRLSPHPVAGGLAKRLGRAITATSANISGAANAAQITELDPVVMAGVDLIIDAGHCPGEPASTVLDVRAQPPRLIREGAVQIDKRLLSQY